MDNSTELNESNVLSLKAFYDQSTNLVKLFNESISSINFNGYVPKSIKKVPIYNKIDGVLNIKPNQYVGFESDSDVLGNLSFYKVINVRIGEGLYEGAEQKQFDPASGDEGIFPSTPPRFTADLFIEYIDSFGSFATKIISPPVNPESYPLDIFILSEEVWTSNDLIFSYKGSSIIDKTISERDKYGNFLFYIKGQEVVKRNRNGFESTLIAEIDYSYISPETFTLLLVEDVDINDEFIITSPSPFAKSLGSDGWYLSSEGNAIFNNVAVRGRIDAKEGNFEGFLTVNKGQMKIGSSLDELNNNGIFINEKNYWYDTGLFQVGNAESNVLWNPNTETLNVTGNITASKIRGSDVYADSLQLGGSEFGWVSASGDIFSGTANSTSYLKSGFYSNPVVFFNQETDSDGKIKRTNANITGKISLSKRSLYAQISEVNGILKKGYQIKINNDYFIIAEVFNESLIKLDSLPSKFYDNKTFTSWYVITTIETQFEVFTELQKNETTKNITFEGVSLDEYNANNIEVDVQQDLKTYITKSIPPIQTIDNKPKSYAKNSLYATLSNIDKYRKESYINRIVSSPSIQGGSFYDTKIYVDNVSEYVNGDLLYLENISKYYYDEYTQSFKNSDVYSLNFGYFPVINTGTDDSYGDYLFVYADGYLSFTGSEINQQFFEYEVNSIEINNGVVTLTVNGNHNIEKGQIIQIFLTNVKKNAESIDFYINSNFTDSATVTYISQNNNGTSTVSYNQNLNNLTKTAISSTGTNLKSLVSSRPTISTKSWEKSYSLTIGDSKPDNAPFQIDQFGQNIKVKNLEVTGDVTGFYYDIIELDDFSAAFDGKKNTFLPKYNQKKVVLDNPLRLVISLNGVVQSAFIRNREYVWQTGFLAYKGYTLDGDGKLKFSESPPSGSTINARVLPGPVANKKSRIYPFKAVDVALG